MRWGGQASPDAPDEARERAGATLAHLPAPMVVYLPTTDAPPRASPFCIEWKRMLTNQPVDIERASAITEVPAHFSF